MGYGALEVQHIHYQPQPSIKAQALAYFLVDCTLFMKVEVKIEPSTITLANAWMLYVDGSSKTGGIGARLTLANPDGIIVELALCFNFNTSNNEVKYKTLLTRLRLNQELEV